MLGWGRNEECWIVAHDVIIGDLETEEPWQRLDAYLKQVWRRADGRGMTLMAACHDSGGHHTNQVYAFSKARLGRRIWAIKGESATGGKRSPVWPTRKLSARGKANFKPVIIGVNSAKDDIRCRLHLAPPAPGEAAAAFIHFPAFLDLGYYSQLLAERLETQIRGGQKYRVWTQRPGRANEALDCLVYGYAALKGLMHHGVKLNRLAETLMQQPARLVPPAPAPEVKVDLSLPGALMPPPDNAPRRPLSQRLA